MSGEERISSFEKVWNGLLKPADEKTVENTTEKQDEESEA